jgi:hypothetical protein
MANIFDVLLSAGCSFAVENVVKYMDSGYEVRTTWVVRTYGGRFECEWAGFDSNEEMKADLEQKFRTVIKPHIEKKQAEMRKSVSV